MNIAPLLLLLCIQNHCFVTEIYLLNDVVGDAVTDPESHVERPQVCACFLPVNVKRYLSALQEIFSVSSIERLLRKMFKRVHMCEWETQVATKAGT